MIYLTVAVEVTAQVEGVIPEIHLQSPALFGYTLLDWERYELVEVTR